MGQNPQNKKGRKALVQKKSHFTTYTTWLRRMLTCELFALASYFCWLHYLRYALHSVVFDVVMCLCVCPSHAAIVFKWLNLS